jgi:hypothetical protein
MSKTYRVTRYDDNPRNVYTYKTWVHIAEFASKELAEAYVARASSPTQKLRVEGERKPS